MVAIVADTHMPKGARRLPDRCLELLGAAELIVHAGDWSALEVVEEIESIGPPVIGVRGNVERPQVRERLPERAEFELGRRRLGVVHDAGPARGRLARMRRAFPATHAVIFGHSHIPLHEADEGGFQIFNPGSPTERRRAPSHTIGLAYVAAGTVRFEHVEV